MTKQERDELRAKCEQTGMPLLFQDGSPLEVSQLRELLDGAERLEKYEQLLWRCLGVLQAFTQSLATLLNLARGLRRDLLKELPQTPDARPKPGELRLGLPPLPQGEPEG